MRKGVDRIWTRYAWEKVDIQHGGAEGLGAGNKTAQVDSSQPLGVPESQVKGLDCVQRAAVAKFW